MIVLPEAVRSSMLSVGFWPSRSNTPLLTWPTDTGIFVDHPAFEGRASWGATFGGYEGQDGSGHGTHCAGTAVSRQFGVAKSANVIAVKVLSDGGRGRNSDM